MVLLRKVIILDLTQGSLVQAQQVALILVLRSRLRQAVPTPAQHHHQDQEICHPTQENKLIKIV